MQIIRLPRQLARLDLGEMNRRLRQGEIRLDWRDVAPDTVQPQHLQRLFDGIDLVERIDALGSETIPESLMPHIQAFFERSAGGDRTISLPAPDADALPMSQALTMPTGAQQKQPSLDIAKRAGGERQQPLLTPPSPARMRQELEEMVVRDLLGPVGGEDEELDEDRVYERYLVGALAPSTAQSISDDLDRLDNLEKMEVEEGVTDEGPVESASAQKSSLNPSSIGLSFCVDLDASELLVTARWGHYQRGHSRRLTTARGTPKTVWQRSQRQGQRVFPLQEGPIERWQPEPEAQPDVYVKGLMRRTATNWLVTLFLVNGQREPKQSRDMAWLFQPELRVEAPGGGPIFQQRPAERLASVTREAQAMAMLYRRQVSFAVGHGVSVHAETLPDDPTCAVRLTTSVLPVYDVPHTEAPTIEELPALSGLVLDMQTLAEMPSADLPAALSPLTDAYAQWIDEQERRISDPAEGLQAYRVPAQEALAQCRSTLARIRAGIDLLSSQPQAARAFAFMNRAMWQQRLHTLYAEERHNGGTRTWADLDAPHNRSWRPFQLAFILLNLPALTDLHHAERSTDPDALADLLWFPTGGGKTEAYLGLTAYTLAIRRLQGMIEGRSGQDGVAVLMRYTLRLLTLQQFQRAAALICACEIIRRADSATWGNTPFRLGLWVGMHSTPNRTEDSAEIITSDHGIARGKFGGVGSPRQLTHCPWCGSVIESGKDIIVESLNKGRGRTLIYCSDSYGQCAFSKAKAHGEGLPVVVVDEEIYRLLPALLIATVDKFAQLPWKGETQMLFGQVEQRCSRHGFRAADLEDSDHHKALGNLPAASSKPHVPLRPPDLIIQDELHLISGPLGTLVGLYETAIDALCTWTVNGKAVRPKVIAATATIRQAEHQIRALFLRKVAIFPPQGLDTGDNFFSRQRPATDETPGRRYLGVCANGRRLKAALIRVYVALLAAAQVLYEKYGAAADPWMTLVGYFNSMSELGGMRRLVDDDVTTRLRRMDERGLAKRRKPVVEELTSRKSSTDIPEVLSRLGVGFGGGNNVKPLDVLLATNMISVGVDVKRLSLMVVTGQPKTTAEYIQATSRVGRTFPGLVCVVYNWARPRDLSHYEQFEYYHATFYRQVEALSVTPFAPRALDRGLAALLVSLVRLTGMQYSKNDTAGNVSADTPAFEQAFQTILRRAEEITSDAEAIERVRRDLLRLKNYWVAQAKKYPRLGYKPVHDGVTLGLLTAPERGDWQPFTCLNSLRDVEPIVKLVFDERPLGEDEITAEAPVEEGEGHDHQ